MRAYRLADWTVFPESDEIVRGGERVKLESRVMLLLDCLCQNAGRVVGRERLLLTVWGRTALSPNSINVAVGALRQALGDDARHPRYIETLRKQGYRLIVPVTPLPFGEVFRQPITRWLLGLPALLSLVLVGGAPVGAPHGKSEPVEALYARAAHLADIRSDVTVKAAHRLATELVTRDPQNGPAYALLARLYRRNSNPKYWGIGGSPAKLGPQSLELARRHGADPAEVLMLESLDLLSAPSNFPAAREKARQAIALNPTQSWVYRSGTWIEMMYGDFGEALARNARGVELATDPGSALSERILPLYFSRRYQEASALFDEVQQRSILPVYYGPQAAVLMGDQVTGFRRWVAFIRAHEIHVPDASEAESWVSAGELARAYDWLRGHVGEYAERPSFPLTSAGWYLAAGDTEACLETLLRAALERDDLARAAFWNWLPYDPYFEPVHDDARWARVVEQAGIFQGRVQLAAAP